MSERDSQALKHVKTSEDTVVLYDGDNHTAWIQSDYFVTVGGSDG